MGWNGSNNGSGAVGSGKVGASVPLARKAAPSFKKGIIAGLIVIIGAGLAAFIIGRGGSPSRPQEAKKSAIKQIAEVKPQIPTNRLEEIEKVEEKTVPAKAEAKPKMFANVRQARSSRQGQVMTLMDGTVVTNTPRHIFTRDFEKTLYISIRPGSMSGNSLYMLTQKYSESELMAMLREMTVPEEGDDEVAVVAKNRVQQLKEEILLEVQRGRSAKDVLLQLRKDRVNDGIVRAEAFKLRTEAVKSGDLELADQTIREANKVLEDRGLRPMNVASPNNADAEVDATPSPDGTENFDDQDTDK